MPLPDPETTNVVRDGLERACKDFTTLVAPLGFMRTKKMFWTRRRDLTVDVIHFHRHGSSYGAPRNFKVDIRVHFSIRVLNDSFEGVALNGPFSDPGHIHEGRYHLSFNAKSGLMYERCVDDLLRFVSEIGEPWFKRFSEASVLLNSKDSPLKGRRFNFWHQQAQGK
jgi:hypothetical protein